VTGTERASDLRKRSAGGPFACPIGNAASELNSLRVPPGNRLEKLVGERAGQYSIRINDQPNLLRLETTAAPAMSRSPTYH
jgi:proteic killer suppression protein